MENIPHLSNISPEDKLILACLSQSSSISQINYDEKKLLHRMSYHRVSSSVYHHLSKLGLLHLFSENFNSILAQNYFYNISQNLKIGFLIKNIGEQLKRKNIDAIVLKGGALLNEIPDYNLVREMSDLDIYVKYKDIYPAIESLSEIGFFDDCSFCEHKYSFKNLYKILFDNALCLFNSKVHSSNFLVELHWQFFSPANNYTLWPRSELWQRAKYIPESSIYQLDSSDLLLHICAHICNNFKIYLYGFFDIASLLKSNPNSLDWNTTILNAKKQGILLHLVNILKLCHELLEVPLPNALKETIQKYELNAESGYNFLIESLFFHEWNEENIDFSRIQAFRSLEPYNLFRYLKLFTPTPIRRKFMNSFQEP